VLGAAMLVMWWSGSRRNARSAQGASVLARLRGARVVRTDASASLPAESEELVDLLCARLDERAARVEALLAETKAAIARLESAHARVERFAADTRARTPDAAPEIETTIRAAPAKAERLDPLCESVYALADSGADALTIAKRLDEHVGKVQLILALRGG